MSDTQTMTYGDSLGALKTAEPLIANLLQASTEASYRYAGLGSFGSTFQTFMSSFDRYGNNPLPPNNEVVGLTFFTRPKLCLATANLKQDRVMSVLNTVDPLRFEFSIRAYLDMKFARSKLYSSLANQSPFINNQSPFIVPLSNSLRNLSGFPDFFLDTETTQGGFFGEDQTIATGSDFNMRSYDFSATFQDVQGGYIMSLFVFWIRYIALVRLGQMIAYPEDVLAQRLNYTCSIYRLVLDPSRRVITKFAKATGCYPKSLPIGAAFDIPDRENYIHATQQFTVPFQCSGAVEYMDPIILVEFNKLIQDWNGGQLPSSLAATNTETTTGSARIKAPVSAFMNFRGIPEIDIVSGANELNFWALPEEFEDPTEKAISQLMDNIGSLKSAVLSGAGR